ncbi:MAG: hypothetical protein ACPGZU_08965 [Ketobacter sp.]|jgi:hypothetical protein|uniref:hypothetical protein n=1 Tax=unclassified Ketobacter TaxID=2639109 RepID=UPI0025B87C8B|nr:MULTISPECIES: hypothetical protein [unclassified Ketobacter]MCK5790105.1 hypothetical protein [Ketobacter sp.]MEC8811386.1 hypothetical protein [Pseudomonadota bacterium]|tara:strand:- start:718 stop:894 length:177 start_codon:yes stop_codon:yes gene_type:complete
MSNTKTETTSTPPQTTTSPEQKRRIYGYGLGHFFKSKQRYKPTVAEKDTNASFELGYN